MLAARRARIVRVLVVDDSALVRNVLSEGLAADAQIEVIGTAANPYEARDLLVRRRPDVITLDIEMPRMDGITFLRKFMRVIPTPTIVVSNLTTAESRAAVEALAAGAVDVLAKPRLIGNAAEATADLATRVKAAAAVDPKLLTRTVVARKVEPRWCAPSASGLIVIGASTGGVRALADLLGRLPENCPPIVVGQHMPTGFTASLAERLNDTTGARVVEASAGMPLEAGTVIIAAANDRHTIVTRTTSGYQTAFRDGDKQCFQRPAIDVLFRSVADNYAGNKIGVLLTGMGSDGARGLMAIREAGGRTLCQDEASSVVYGMPRAAWELGAGERQCALAEVPQVLASWVQDWDDAALRMSKRPRK